MQKTTNLSALHSVIGGIAVALLCLSSCRGVSLYSCEARRVPPTAFVYPDADLISQVELGTDRHPLISYQYGSIDTPQDVIAFYEEHGSCRYIEDTSRVVCQGRSIPFGEYFVYLDPTEYETDRGTLFTLEVEWNACSNPDPD
jgi:hypothetical protein